MTGPIAIIGAGIAGLTAAHRLHQAGVETVVFEKSRGLGGRMATRRHDGFQFDHGAQFFNARNPAFKTQVSSWLADGAAGRWNGMGYVGTPGMTAPAQRLADRLTVETEHQIECLSRNGNGWTLATADGPVSSLNTGGVAAVILAIPAPQAVTLAATADVDLNEAAATAYAPCMALMAAFPEKLPEVPDTAEPDDSVIAWYARNASKPSRNSAIETFVVHATPGWSAEHQDWPKEDIADALSERFKKVATIQDEPTLKLGHRWRYARVTQPLGRPCVWREDIGLGACGDWCLGPRVESAFESGTAMADTILKWISAK